ncbi:MAG: hypothetical protein H6Q52_2069 [Deltaproteobacteria bacterium]|nr:hypothetical protein [Deltaproteobacteria bacterium]
MAFFVSLGFTLRRADCAPYCSPVVEVMNYQQFSELLKNIVKNLLITQLKANVSEKLSFSYRPGNFMSFTKGGLVTTTNFSSMVSGIVAEGLKCQADFVNSEMSITSFANTINNAALTILSHELKQYGIDKKEITTVLSNYRKALNCDSIVGTYSGQVREYQSMVSEFLPVASNLMTQMTGLSGKIDIASSMRSKQKDVISNTRETLSECAVHTRDGLKILADIANLTIGDSMNVNFTTANAEYLKVRLGKIASGSGKAALTDEDVEKIILKVNNAAVQIVPQYVTRSTNSLVNISSGTAAAIGTAMNTKVQSALTAINNAMYTEKAQEEATKNLYSSMEHDVMELVGNLRNYGTYAREKRQESLFDDSSLKKIMVLLAARKSSATFKKLAIKHYITARTSLEVAASIKTQLNKFNPGTIDSGYEDQAWKDLARFEYYLLHLENQQLKLMAIRAMAQAIDTDDPDVLKYAASSGLPAD